MSYRILRNSSPKKEWYTIQEYKVFLFWKWWSVIQTSTQYPQDMKFNSVESAKEYINEQVVVTEIVETW